MKTFVRMTTVAAMVGMIVSLSSLDAFAGGNGTRYRVELRHPRTGRPVMSAVKGSKAEADKVRVQFARVTWKFWRYVGINEPLHQRRFSSPQAAGHWRPPIGVLETQYVKRGRVVMREVQ